MNWGDRIEGEDRKVLNIKKVKAIFFLRTAFFFAYTLQALLSLVDMEEEEEDKFKKKKTSLFI